MGLRRDPKSKALILDPEPQDVRIVNMKRVVSRIIGVLLAKKLVSPAEAAQLEKELKEL